MKHERRKAAYRDVNRLPAKRGTASAYTVASFSADPAGMEEFKSMTKEELIEELVKALNHGSPV